MMTALWLQNLLFYSLQVSLAVLAGGVLVRILRPRDPRLELIYLQGVLAVCLALPFLQPWRAAPARPAPVAPLEAAADGPAPYAGARDAAALSPFHATAWLLAAGAALRFAWIGVGLLRLARYRGKSAALTAPPAFAAVLQQRLGTNAALRISAEVRGPVTFGWLRPVVLLPERFLDFEPDLQQAVVCHELLHVQRRDWLFAVAEECVRALLWFHPAVWWLIGRIHLVREQLVDREAIRLTDSRDPYLRALLAVAGHHLQPDLAPASLFLRKHHLDQRVAAVVRKEIPMSRIRSLAWLSLMSGAVVAVVWFSVSTFPLHAVPQAAAGQLPGPVRSPAGVVEQGAENLLQEAIVPYPAEAIRKRVEGRVTLELSIGEDGRVNDAMVVSGPQELRRVALMSALQWQYSTEMRLPAKAVVGIQFRLPPAGFPAQDSPQANTRPADRLRINPPVQQERLVHKVIPVYPPLARQAKVAGKVLLSVSIAPTGKVDYIDVLSGHPLLVPAALQAVRQWAYRPTLLNGKPIGVDTNVEIQFWSENQITAAPPQL